jgi:hypothetical protein
MHSDMHVWIEEESGSLRNVHDIPTLPDTWLPYQGSRFLHIETRTLTCSISHLASNDLTSWHRGIPGWYATIRNDRSLVCYARFHPSGSTIPTQANQYSGLVLPFALAGLIDIYNVDPFRSILIVEDKGEFWERVGVVHIYFCSQHNNWVEEADAAFCVEEDGSENDHFHELKRRWKLGFEGEVRRVRMG